MCTTFRFTDSSPLPSEDIPDGGGNSWNNSPHHSPFKQGDHQHELEHEPDPDLDVSIDMFENFDWTRHDAIDPDDVAISAKRHSQPEVQVKRVAQLTNAPRAASMEARVVPRRKEGPPKVSADGEVEPLAIPTVVVSSALNEGASASGRGSISQDSRYPTCIAQGHSARVEEYVDSLGTKGLGTLAPKYNTSKTRVQLLL